MADDLEKRVETLEENYGRLHRYDVPADPIDMELIPPHKRMEELEQRVGELEDTVVTKDEFIKGVWIFSLAVLAAFALSKLF